jgi:pyruvate dehydrogenase E1 component beta subunit
MPIGIWAGSAAQHSQSLEAWFAHVPGLVVVTPGSAQDNYSLLAAAIACGDPVIYMEHKELWGLEGDVEQGDQTALGRAKILRPGNNVTLLTDIHFECEVDKEGIAAELIDLRTIWPWDRETVLASAAKTRRLVVAHEAVRVAGFGAEIAATVAEELGIPVKRLGGARIPVGYSRPLEDESRLDADAIVQALLK